MMQPSSLVNGSVRPSRRPVLAAGLLISVLVGCGAAEPSADPEGDGSTTPTITQSTVLESATTVIGSGPSGGLLSDAIGWCPPPPDWSSVSIPPGVEPDWESLPDGLEINTAGAVVRAEPDNADVFFDPLVNGWVASFTSSDPERNARIAAALAPWPVEFRVVEYTMAELLAGQQSVEDLKRDDITTYRFDVISNRVFIELMDPKTAEAAFFTERLVGPLSMYCLSPHEGVIESPA